MWGENMRSNRTITTITLVALTALYAATTASAQVHVRGSSENGEDSNAPHWMLMGLSQNAKLSNSGKTATMRHETICLTQDVEDSQPSPVLAKSGGCDTGDYMYLSQFQSNANNLSVNIGHLKGFNPADTTTFGVMICDSPTNTIELCTNATASQIPNITATTTSNSVTFTVPNAFPNYPSGTAQQGRGLTFYVITSQQASPLPLGLPTVGIH
jgi:hypothetical protein